MLNELASLRQCRFCKWKRLNNGSALMLHTQAAGLVGNNITKSCEQRLKQKYELLWFNAQQVIATIKDCI